MRVKPYFEGLDQNADLMSGFRFYLVLEHLFRAAEPEAAVLSGVR